MQFRSPNEKEVKFGVVIPWYTLIHQIKQLLKEKLGFKGYKIGEFSPIETRRATAANWLLSNMELHP